MTVECVPFVAYSQLHEDDRGAVYCALDNMHENQLKTRDRIKRTYVVRNWSKGMIRCWHGHLNGWTGIHVLKGAAKVGAKRIDFSAPDNILFQVLSDNRPGIFWIPPGWFNGAMSLVDDTRLLVYSTLTFEEVKKDDHRATPSQAEVNEFEAKFR